MPLLFCAENVLTLISATGRTGAVSLLRLLALRADRDTGSFQAIMGTAHIALGFRGFLLRYCHCLSVSLIPGHPVFIDYRGVRSPESSLFGFKVFQGGQPGMKNRRGTLAAFLIQIAPAYRAESLAGFFT